MIKKLSSWLNLPDNYNSSSFRHDTVAGITVFIMLVPQGMAYALLAGLPPVMGLYASILPLLIYACFGSSRQLAIGPVAMASILVFAGVSLLAEPQSTEYISLVLLLTLMVGCIQFILGMVNAGTLVKFISRNVINGFTSAVAIMIGLSQLGNFFGIQMASQTQLFPLIAQFVSNISQIHFPTALIGIGSLALLAGLRKIKLPMPLVVVAGSILLVYFFRLDEAGVNIVGEVPQGLPSFTLPEVSLASMQLLLPTALTIALIAMMESLAITKTLAGRDSPPVNINKELRGIGLSNIGGSFFSAYPVTGSFSRSAVNQGAGAVSQISMIITALGVLLTLLFLTPLFYYLPQAVLAAIILSAVSGLINFKSARQVFRIKPSDGWVWVITFCSTLLVGIQWGLLIGVGVSLCILINRISHPHVAELGWHAKTQSYRDLHRFPEASAIPNITIVRIDARIHFSNVEYLEHYWEEKLKELERKHDDKSHLVIDMAGVNDIDTMGIEALERLIQKYDTKEKLQIWLVNLKGPVYELLRQAGWEERFPENIKYFTLSRLMTKIKPPTDYMI
ncbi:SulP family inorganic anion transporter [Alkalicoccus daliensis]|uniref:Sulfate permease, SulP family n=1 Tax=Alkalicoccus daliensis TaxID=745820 RepID=A0A1H0F3S1_9BACI|nr:sulfate permease [Alkalicoccus daliensis]SDN89282.1 sulfate permease, SulP family [Alkalicoccus daliensis]